MLRIPIRIGGGVAPALTISEMKFAVIPIMAIIDAACRILATLKVAPRTP